MDERLAKYLDYSKTFEQTEKDSINSKLKTKNITIGILGVTCVSLAIAITVMSPLKQKEAVIIRVDNLKGTTSILTNTDVETLNIDKNEVIDKNNLANYVINREGYDWNYGETIYNKTMLMTSPQIVKEYQMQFHEDNPNALDKKYGNHTRVVIENPSVSFYTDSALVRFTKKIITGSQIATTNEMATIAYKYVTTDMSDEDRLVNPLGFQVISYRVDKDLTSGSVTPSPIILPSSEAK
jgi:type IV secretion system protein VirB8